MANPNGIAGWYQIVLGNVPIRKVYLASGIFNATELYRKDTGCESRLSARPIKMSREMFSQYVTPQL